MGDGELSVEAFYERIKEGVKRVSPPTTIEAVAASAGMTRNRYNGYRRLGHYPRTDETFLIARQLHTSVEYLLTGVQRICDIPPPRLYSLVRDLAILSDEQIKAVHSVVSAMIAAPNSERGCTTAI